MSYSHLKQYFGSFWGLYLMGIGHPFNLKWFGGQLIIQLYMQFLITSYINELTIKESTADIIIRTSLIICIIRIISGMITFAFNTKILIEKSYISTQIGNYINNLYSSASYNWKSKNGHTAQKESLREIFYAYNGMTNTLSYTLQSMIQSSVVLMVAFTNDLSIGIAIIIGSAVLLKLKKYLDRRLTELDSRMADTLNSIQLHISNQFANRIDIGYTPKYKLLYKPEQFDPIDGLQKSQETWDNRDTLADKSELIINILQCIYIVVISMYLWYIQKATLIIFVILNNNNLFGFLDVIVRLEQIKNISSSRVATSFKMIDEIIEEGTVLTDVIICDQSFDTINQIQIKNINRKINDKINLMYDDSIITINFNKKGIILLDGSKGCGKSVTMDILAGMYDDHVADVYVNMVPLPNEFRDLVMCRTYIRQCVVDDYKQNKKNTICQTLAELFPQGSYFEIQKFLFNFDMIHKMPEKITDPISLDERGLSPGESQSIIVASQIWKAFKSKSKLLLLDEPERNIDLDTVKKFFDMINKEFIGTVILITHLPELKIYLKSHIKEVWKYKSNNGGNLSFTVQDNTMI